MFVDHDADVFRRTPTVLRRKCVNCPNVIVNWSFSSITWNCCMINS